MKLMRKMVNPYPQKYHQPAKNALVKVEQEEVPGNRKKKASSLMTVVCFQYSPLCGRQGLFRLCLVCLGGGGIRGLSVNGVWKTSRAKKGNKRNYKAQRKRWEKFEKPTTTGKAN